MRVALLLARTATLIGPPAGAQPVSAIVAERGHVDEAAADPPGLPDVACALHHYAATHKRAIRDKAETALARQAALCVTEYGTIAANGDAPIDAAKTRNWWDWCDPHRISYLNWWLSDKPEASAALKHGASTRGGWRPDQLTPSGMMVRNQLRAAADNEAR